MKSLISFLFLIMPMAALAGSFVQGLPDGAYHGKFRGQKKGTVNFIVRGYAGCDGCFIAYKLKTPELLGDRTVDLVAYSALPMESVNVNGRLTSKRYSLTPIGVDSTGDLTLPNDDPSLILNISKGVGTRDAEFTITSAQSGNRLGGVESMVFLWSREAPFEIIQPSEGQYRDVGSSKVAATVTSLKTEEDGAHSAHILWMGNIRQEGGDFLLKERLPGVYTFNAISYRGEGNQVRNMPAFIVMFVHGNGQFCFEKQDMMLMVNPVNHVDVSKMILK